MRLVEKKLCCGCRACSEICANHAISMVEDETGFLFPHIDEQLCVYCNRCADVCPITHAPVSVAFTKHAFIGQLLDEKKRAESTSGGVFSALAEKVLSIDGVAFGAAMSEDFVVEHIAIEKLNDLSRLRNSKYVQSDMKHCYPLAKAYLDAGRQVIFSGTPCQICGLRNFLNKDYSNLLCVDVVCRSVASPLALRKYLEWQRSRYGSKITSVRFRDKTDYGYEYSQMAVRREGESRSRYARGIEEDPLLRGYFSDVIIRESCYYCKFRGSDKHRSDVTLWDCANVRSYSKTMDKRGTTKILVHTSKGMDAVLAATSLIKCEEIFPVERLFDHVRNRGKMICVPQDKRTSFFRDAQTMDGESLYQKHYPDTVKAKLERFAKILFIKIGVYSWVRSKVK